MLYLKVLTGSFQEKNQLAKLVLEHMLIEFYSLQQDFIMIKFS